MPCPFLQKSKVKYCGLYRLAMIPVEGRSQATEKCAGAGYRDCPLAQAHHDGALPPDRCPFLRYDEVHSCQAAAVRKAISCNEAAASRCTDDGYRHCPAYLAMAAPRDDDDGAGAAPRSGGALDDTIPTPDHLAYSSNHLWLDCGGGHTCHVGVDAFVGRALGRIDALSFPFRRADGRPVVRLHTGGVAFDLVFPNLLPEVETNAHLAVDPADAVRDPYGRGWLFEGMLPATAGDRAVAALGAGLRRGESARDWMQDEWDRLARFVHDRLHEAAGDAVPVLQDGGFPCRPLGDVLDRHALIRLEQEFFSLRTGRTDS